MLGREYIGSSPPTTSPNTKPCSTPSISSKLTSNRTLAPRPQIPYTRASLRGGYTHRMR